VLRSPEITYLTTRPRITTIAIFHPIDRSHARSVRYPVQVRCLLRVLLDIGKPRPKVLETASSLALLPHPRTKPLPHLFIRLHEVLVVVVFGLEQLDAQPPDGRDVCLSERIHDGVIQRKELPPARRGERVLLIWQRHGLNTIVPLDDARGGMVHDASEVAGFLEGSAWLACATFTTKVPVFPQDCGTLEG